MMNDQHNNSPVQSEQQPEAVNVAKQKSPLTSSVSNDMSGAIPCAPEQGLYRDVDEHDACGVGFVVDMYGRKSHDIINHAMTVQHFQSKSHSCIWPLLSETLDHLLMQCYV